MIEIRIPALDWTHRMRPRDDMPATVVEAARRVVEDRLLIMGSPWPGKVEASVCEVASSRMTQSLVYPGTSYHLSIEVRPTCWVSRVDEVKGI